MFLDYRYHIASLAAVFLALGLGIIIGSALPGNEALVKEQERIISRLEKDFEQLRMERKVFQETLKSREVELEVMRQFNREIMPAMISGTLKDRKIAIIKTNETVSSRLVEEIGRLLKQAGAEVPVVVSFLEWPDLSVEGAGLAARLNFNPEKPWLDTLFQQLVSEIAGQENHNILGTLHEMNLLQYKNQEGGFIDSVIILGGSYEEKACRADIIDLPLIKAAKSIGLTVIGVEPLDVTYSYISQYKNSGLATVDNVNTIPGQAALVFSLAGRKKGHYGVKETARAILPDLSLMSNR